MHIVYQKLDTSSIFRYSFSFQKGGVVETIQKMWAGLDGEAQIILVGCAVGFAILLGVCLRWRELHEKKHGQIARTQEDRWEMLGVGAMDDVRIRNIFEEIHVDPESAL